MKRRNRKKAFDCAHHVFGDFLVTDDPYPIYNTEDYCKIGKFDNTWLAPERKNSLCDNCKRFCASRPMIRKKREGDKRFREYSKRCNKYYNSVFKAGRWEEQDF